MESCHQGNTLLFPGEVYILGLSAEGGIEKEQLDEMKKVIQENKADWFEILQNFDDPNTGMEDIW